MEVPIPFNQPILAGNEITYVTQSLQSGHVSASGPYSRRATGILREALGAAEVFLTTSCTDALEMGGMLLGLGPGDVVIVPSFTFVSTALAMVRQGVKLRFADIERKTLGLDPQHVSDLLDEKVKAIIPVHYGGIGCDLEGLRAVVKNKPIDLFEDNAQGLFATSKGVPLGSFGRLSALSFHETKNFTCGEGGALVVNRKEDVERARLLYEKGTNRQAFKLGMADKYSWVDMGSSFGLSDVLAAYLTAQLEARDAIQGRRKAIWDQYFQLLEPSSGRLAFSLPFVPADRKSPYHLFYVLLKDQSARDRAIKALRARGIEAAFHYVPLHNAAGAKAHLDRVTPCPVTEEISGRLLRLPLHNGLTDDQVQRVTEGFLKIMEKI